MRYTIEAYPFKGVQFYRVRDTFNGNKVVTTSLSLESAVTAQTTRNAQHNQASVMFDFAPYERAHMKAPRGMGSWAFCPYDQWRRDNYLDSTLFVTGSFTEAKRVAREHFGNLGITSVVVCS